MCVNSYQDRSKTERLVCLITNKMGGDTYDDQEYMYILYEVGDLSLDALQTPGNN